MSRVVAAVLICGIGFYVLPSVPVAGASMQLFAEAAAGKSAPDPSQKPKNTSAGKPVTQPGLPIRKPPKPKLRRKPAAKKSSKKPLSQGTERDMMLCRALQACRNVFIECKSKIKHADQSEAWIIAKEECGAHYKTCVEKDFQQGEWFFTRWFYFQELKCK